MPQPSFFINQFNKSAENANIGLGTVLGIDTYSKKGVAQLTKDTTLTTANGFTWPSVPKYIATNGSGVYSAIATRANGDCGFFYSNSADNLGQIWNDTNTSITQPEFAAGLIYYQGYYLAFTATKMYFYTDATAPASGGGVSPFTGFNSGEHPTFLFPPDNNVYFGNGNTIGMIGAVPGAAFNPGGTINVNYQFYANRSGSIGGNTNANLLPAGYQINCLSYQLPFYLAIGTGGISKISPISDLILWNIALPTAETPLRLYTRAQLGGGSFNVNFNGCIQNGIAQIVNRNNLLYCLTAGNCALYETNGTNFSLITDLSLRSNIRKTTGMENTIPVYMGAYAPAMAVIGNKILIGISTPNTPQYPTNYGLFPCGVWTVAFSDGGSIGEVSYGINGNSVQCEYTISTNTIVATNGNFQIGCILPLFGSTALISWADGTTYGIDYINTGTTTTYYQNNINVTLIESEMMEVGTPLGPVTIGNLQANLVRNLMTGQTISLYYRTAFDQDFTLIKSGDFNGVWTGDGTKNGYSVTNHQIGPTRYIQFQLHMATVSSITDATIATYTPQLKDFIVGQPMTQ